jgi:hypothetical protein
VADAHSGVEPPLGGVNEALELGEDRVELRFGAGRPVQGHARTVLRMLPHPRFESWIELSAVPETAVYTDDGSQPTFLRYPDRRADVAVHQAGLNHSREGAITFVGVFVAGASLVTGDGSALTRVEFRLMNFPDFYGRVVIPGLGPRHAVVLEADGWRVTLRSTSQTATNVKQLRQVGGYGLTHVGEVRRTDGEAFTAREADELFTCLHYFFAFAAGAWTPLLLPIGFDSAGNRVWEEWQTPRSGRWSYLPSWFDRFRPEQLAQVFPGFRSLWNAGFWGMELRKAVHWYVSSNQVEGGVEGALILSYTALELIAWITLVEDWQRMTKTAFKDLKGEGRKLSALLAELGIPSAIPSRFPVLSALAQEGGWADGPWALNAMRNSLIHPEKRDSASSATGQATVDAWWLAQWYVELALLHLCDHQGTYANRLDKEAWPSQAEKVPWA